MKLTFLGTGAAFTVGNNNFHSNILLESDTKKNLLIDCGSDARLSLYKQHLGYKDINAVYISHLHADHAGGLEWLAFCTKFDNCPKPTLFISQDLEKTLWKNVLLGGLQSLNHQNISLSSFFKVKAIGKKHSFMWQKMAMQMVATRHVKSDNHWLPSYGLFITYKNKKILITTDTQFYPSLFKEYYEKADIIFHDCETTRNRSHVHTHYKDLLTLPKAIRNKMWLYHYNDGKLPNAKKDGFKGFVKCGQQFDFK